MNLAARRLIQNNFREALLQYSNIPKRNKVAIVGGSLAEPEVATLKELGFESSITTFGIDGCDIFLDLNKSNLNLPQNEFDLVLCSQVLEHVWNMDQVFENLTSIVNKQGFIWIGCPTSNMKHEGGSTRYYSAGYQAIFVENYLTKFKFRTLYKGEIGSERLYKLTHCKFTWPSEKEYNSPLKSKLNRVIVLKSIRNLSLRSAYLFLEQIKDGLLVSWWDKEIEVNSAFATETYVFATPIRISHALDEVLSQKEVQSKSIDSVS